MKKIFTIILLLIAGAVHSQAIDQKLLLCTNSQTNGGEFSFYYQIKGSNLPTARTLASLNVDLIYDSTLLRFDCGCDWYNNVTSSYGYESYVQSNNSENGIYKAVRISIISPYVNNDGKNLMPGYDLEDTYRNIIKIKFIILDNSKKVNISIKSETNQIGLFVNMGNNPNTFEMIDTKLSSPILLNDIPLPIRLAEFKGNVSGRDVNLIWKTSFEENNHGFEIERKSSDGEFSKIGFIEGNNKSSSYSFIDRKLNNGKFTYRLKQIDNNGNYEYFNLDNDIVVGLPHKYNLSQNYPNPFNPSSKIDFELPKDCRVNILIYDMLGREVNALVNNESMQAGYHTVEINASKFASGTYFYKMHTSEVTGNQQDIVKKMTVVK